ncbi:MAG: LysR family transcriptional regulator [Acidobacteriota bacterium]|nr:LysR family transcriptional regulator [Acidobacteriota bacterium]
MNISAFDLNVLPVFEAVMDERSVSRAAVRVGLSQPAVSNAIRRMREAMGDPLWIRTARGMTPTPRAEQLAGPVRAALAHMRSALAGESAFDPATTTRTFRLAMNDYSEWRMEAAIVAGTCGQSSGASVQVRRVDTLFGVPEADLRNGVVDVAIGFFPDPRNLGEGTLSETLFEEDNVVVGRRGNRALRKQLTLERFAELDHAAVIYRAEPWGIIDQELASHGLRRRLRLATPHFLTALKAVAESDLIACVPEGLAREFEESMGLVIRAVPVSLPRFVTRMLWARQWQEDAAHVWLRGKIREAADRPGKI